MQPSLLENEFIEASLPSNLKSFVPGFLQPGLHGNEFSEAPLPSTIKTFVPGLLQPGLLYHRLGRALNQLY